MAAVVSGMYSVFFEHPERESGQVGEESYASEEGFGGLDGLENITQSEMYGTVIDLPEGVKVSTASPGRPNQNFNAFIASLVQQVGGALGIPSELLFLHFTASYWKPGNYLDIGVNGLQVIFVSRFMKNFYISI